MIKSHMLSLMNKVFPIRMDPTMVRIIMNTCQHKCKDCKNPPYHYIESDMEGGFSDSINSLLNENTKDIELVGDIFENPLISLKLVKKLKKLSPNAVIHARSRCKDSGIYRNTSITTDLIERLTYLEIEVFSGTQWTLNAKIFDMESNSIMIGESIPENSNILLHYRVDGTTDYLDVRNEICTSMIRTSMKCSNQSKYLMTFYKFYDLVKLSHGVLKVPYWKLMFRYINITSQFGEHNDSPKFDFKSVNEHVLIRTRDKSIGQILSGKVPTVIHPNGYIDNKIVPNYILKFNK